MSLRAYLCLLFSTSLLACSSSGDGGGSRGGAGGDGGFLEPGGSGGSEGGSGGTLAEGGSGGMGGSGGTVVDPGPTECAQQGSSICGEEASIIRVLARLPASAQGPAKGRLRLNLRHVRLGDGEHGGYPHVPLFGPAPRFDVNLQPGQNATGWLDMCEGGIMWSEENCEFNLFAWVDFNNNEQVDPGEPAGRKIIDVSCHDGGSPCYTIDLDCTDGISCVAFNEPAVCQCVPEARGCRSPQEIITCTP